MATRSRFVSAGGGAADVGLHGSASSSRSTRHSFEPPSVRQSTAARITATDAWSALRVAIDTEAMSVAAAVAGRRRPVTG